LRSALQIVKAPLLGRESKKTKSPKNWAIFFSVLEGLTGETAPVLLLGPCGQKDIARHSPMGIQ
jgi:hypothetical protein